jgi:hypothetical protein
MFRFTGFSFRKLCCRLVKPGVQRLAFEKMMMRIKSRNPGLVCHVAFTGRQFNGAAPALINLYYWFFFPKFN